MAKKILIVDDSKTVRQQVNFTLTRSGYTVVEAGDGDEGIAAFGSNPDVAMIISDVNMPKMNGIDMISKLTESGCKAPIIMLTTEGAAELIAKAKSAGARGWLVKPFQPEQLIQVVTKLAGAA
jgi:two-component system chemotaxis response regulator CheY